MQSDERFFSRVFSKKISSKAESSFRVLYYGGSSGSIPFTWESQPGTPKHPILTSDPNSPPPPLTPPPSFKFTPSPRTNLLPKKGPKPKPKPNPISAIFPKLTPLKKNHVSPPPLSSSSTSSSCSSGSHSSASIRVNPRDRRLCFLFRSRSNPRNH